MAVGGRLSLGLLEGMQASRLQADIATYREAILSLEQDQYWSKAIDILDEAIAARLQPDEDAYRATIKVLQGAHQMAAVQRLEDEIMVSRLKAEDKEGRTASMSNRLLRHIGGALKPVT